MLYCTAGPAIRQYGNTAIRQYGIAAARARDTTALRGCRCFVAPVPPDANRRRKKKREEEEGRGVEGGGQRSVESHTNKSHIMGLLGLGCQRMAFFFYLLQESCTMARRGKRGVERGRVRAWMGRRGA